MAGSHPDNTAPSPSADPVIAARLEAIKQLAGGLSDRVAVMDRGFNVVYANEAAWTVGQVAKTHQPQAKCFEAFAHRTDPCDACPALKVFEASEVQSVSCSNGGDGTTCGMQQAFPLLAGDGQIASILVLFKPTSKPRSPSVAHVPEEVAPPMVREHLGDLIGGRKPCDRVDPGRKRDRQGVGGENHSSPQ
jgi:two-component system response regulator AtoC